MERKKIIKHIKAKVSWIISVAFALVLTALLSWMVEHRSLEFSAFPIMILRVMLGVATLQWVIKITLGGVHQREIVEEHNKAYAIIVLAFAIVIAAGVCSF